MWKLWNVIELERNVDVVQISSINTIKSWIRSMPQFVSVCSLKLWENTQKYILFSYDISSLEAVIEGVLLNDCFSDLKLIIRIYTQSLYKVPMKEFIFIKAAFFTPCNFTKNELFRLFFRNASWLMILQLLIFDKHKAKFFWKNINKHMKHY